MVQEFGSSLEVVLACGLSWVYSENVYLGMQSSEKFCLGLENLLPRWVSHMAVGRGLLILSRHTSSSGCLRILTMWLHPAWMIRESESEAAMSFMTLLQNPPTVTSAISYWFYKLFLLIMGGDAVRGWLSESGTHSGLTAMKGIPGKGTGVKKAMGLRPSVD